MILQIPTRPTKPRIHGLNCMIDPGLPLNFFHDVITSYHSYIDYVKFGWGTGIISPVLHQKINVLKQHNIEFWFGGTLFEIFYIKNQLHEFVNWVKKFDVTIFEISDGTINISLEDKLETIQFLAKSFKVISEVGSKDSEKIMSPSQWTKCIRSELAAGAWKIIAEGRESGTAGIYRHTGEVRMGLIQELSEAGLDFNKIIFEAPQKTQQAWFINNLGINVNLGNISFHDVLNLETLRLGLRSDTMQRTQTKAAVVTEEFR